MTSRSLVRRSTHSATSSPTEYKPIHKGDNDVIFITFYGQCCRLHVVGQQVVSDVRVVCSCRNICSVCSESNNIIILYVTTSAHYCTWNVYFLLQIANIVCPATWRRVLGDHGMDTEFSDVTAA